jgi:hypothetical protein
VEVRNLEPLSGMTKLERLAVHCGHDVDLSPLLTLGALRELRLLGDPVRDLGRLASLKKLEVLAVGRRDPRHQGCEQDTRYVRRVDGALLGPWLARPENPGEDVTCSWEICDIDPSACPTFDFCTERRTRRRK